MFGLSKKEIEKVVESQGALIECHNPLEISRDKDESWASGYFAELAIQDLIFTACNNVLDVMTNEWHEKLGTDQELREYLGFTNAEYSMWVMRSSNISEKHIRRLIDEYLKEPSKYQIEE